MMARINLTMGPLEQDWFVKVFGETARNRTRAFDPASEGYVMLRNMGFCCLAVLIQLSFEWKSQAAQDGSNGARYTVIISGIGGEAKFEEAYWNWASGI